MRILVTGGNGFIGRHVLPLLGHHQLLLIGRREIRLRQPDVSYVRGDLAEAAQWEDAVRKFAPQACIHLAWSGLPDYSLAQCLDNFNAGVRLIEFLSNMDCDRIFVAGTCWEYGDLRGQVAETDLPGTMSLFAATKTALRLIGENLAASRAKSFLWGRLFFVYGPGQRETSLIPSCYRAFKDGRAPEINNPHAINDFIHVEDVARAIQALIESPGTSGVFNIGSGSPASVGEVCRLVSQYLRRADYDPDASAHSAEQGMWADVSLLRAKTGWKPRLTLQAGIEETLNAWEGK